MGYSGAGNCDVLFKASCSNWMVGYEVNSRLASDNVFKKRRDDALGCMIRIVLFAGACRCNGWTTMWAVCSCSINAQVGAKTSKRTAQASTTT